MRRNNKTPNWLSMPLSRGFFVAFEGIDGSGKTTQARRLVERLREAGCKVIASKEPTNGQWGQKIRASKTNGRMEPAFEVQAFLNDRKEHVAELLDPALASGSFVVVDRYYYSTLAYQGARGLDVQELRERNEAFAPKPDLVVLLDIDPAEGRRRINGRGDEADLFEGLEDLTKARAIFNDMDDPHILRIDATLLEDEIHERVFRAMVRILGDEADLAAARVAYGTSFD